jgi:hypothetical protein
LYRCLVACCFNVAAADVRIEGSTGGNALSYLALFESLRQSGQRIVIDGPCFSACTLVLISIPRRRICVTRRAMLGFHAAKAIDLKVAFQSNFQGFLLNPRICLRRAGIHSGVS